MSINNPIVVINALTANIIKLENDNFDLKARLKESREKLASLKPSNSALEKDYMELIKKLENKTGIAASIEIRISELNKQLEDCREALRNRSAREVDLQDQLSAERGAAAYLRNYFIKFNQDAIEHLCGCIVGMVKTGDKPLPLRVKSGVLALSPINFAFTGGKIAVKTEEAMAKIRALESDDNE